MENLSSSIFIYAQVFLGIFLMYLLADFITGVVHWWEDAYGNPSWPVLGKYVVEPNLEHHRKPRKILQGNYWHKVDTSVYAMIILGIIFYFCGWLNFYSTAFLIFASQGNAVHTISHRTREENGSFVTCLQKIGIFQTKKTHGLHHTAPYDVNFCVMTEYLNPILTKIRFWTGIEWVLLKIFKIKVLRGSPLRGGI